MNKPRTQSRGYTLIELLLYVGIVGILLTAVTALFATSVDSRVKNQSINEVNSQGTYALDIMTQTVRGANSISSPVVGTPGSQLTIVVPTSSLSPTIFTVTNGVLQIKEGTGTAVSLTNSEVQVSSLTVTNLTRSGTKGIVQISFVISRINASSRNEYDYQRTFTTSVGVRP